MKLSTEGNTPHQHFNTLQIFPNKPEKTSPVLVAGPSAIPAYLPCSVAPSSGGLEESSPNRRGRGTSLPQLSLSANRLSKNIPSPTEKIVRPTPGDGQPRDVLESGNRVNKCHQKSSDVNAGPSWNKAQGSKASSGKRQSKAQAPQVASQLPVDRLRESVSPEGKPRRSPLDPRCRGASANELFLDLQCMKIMKEGADEDEDSASDLSDSERVPVPSSALAPPELHLRAEEIDAADPDPGRDLDPRSAQLTYRYADFLPAPFSSWDLRDLAMPPGATEPRPAAQGGAAGLLARYIDRLLQLEWLQMQTVQSEKGRGAKARPPSAPGSAAGPLKSPGRSKLVVSAPARPHQEGAPKPGAPRRRDPHREEARPSYYTFDPAPRALRASQKPALEGRTEEQKKKWSKSPRLRRWDPPGGDSGPGPGADMGGGGGGGGPSLQVATIRDPCGAPRAQAPGSLKKKGSVSACSPAPIPSEKKLRTNGVKQSPHRVKK